MKEVEGSVVALFDDYEASVEFTEELGVDVDPTIEKYGIRWLIIAQLLTFCYFAFFIIVLPLLGLIEKPKDEPESIADSVHKTKSDE